MRRVLAGFGWLLLALVSLVASVYAHLHTGLARETIREEALSLVSAQLRGRIEASAMPTLTTERIVVRGATIYDPEGKQVAHVERLEAHFELHALLAGTVHLPYVSARGGFVELDHVASDERGLAAAFQPTGPPQPESDEGSAIEIRLADIRVDELNIRRTLPGMGPSALTGLRLRGALRYSQFLTLEVSRLAAGIRRGKTSTGRVASGRATVHLQPQKPSQAQLALRIARTDLALQGSWTLLPDDAASPLRLDASVDVDGLSSKALRALGQQAAASQLRASVDAHVEAQGTLQDLQASAYVEAADGRMELDAELRDARHIDAKLTLKNVSPHRIVAAGPQMRIAGRIETAYEMRDAADPFSVSLRSLRLGEARIPSLDIRGALLRDAVRIDDVDAPYLDGKLAVAARVGFDGALRATVKADIPTLQQATNLRRVSQDLRGSLFADIDLRRTKAGRLNVDGRIELEGVSTGDVDIGHASLQARASGHPRALSLDADVSARNASFGKLRVQRLALRAEGGPRTYRFDGRLRAKPVKARVDGRMTREGDTFRFDAEARAKGLADRAWEATVQGLQVHPSQGVAAELVRVRTGEQSVRAHGRYAFEGASDLRVRAEAVSLKTVGALASATSLPAGRIDLDARLRGSPSAPRVELSAHYSDGVRVQDETLDLKVEGRLDAPAGAARLEARARLGNAGRASLRAQSDFRSGRRSWIQRLRAGRHDVTVDLQSVRWTMLHMLAPEVLPPGQGEVRAHAEVHGTTERAEAELAVSSRVHLKGDPSPIEMGLDARYDTKELQVELQLDDDQGELVEAHGDVALDTRLLASGPGAIPAVLSEASWSLSTKLHSRRLDELPLVPAELRDAMPLRLGVELQLEHAPGQEPSGDMKLHAVWDLPDLEAHGPPSPRPRKRRSTRCPQGPSPELDLHAHLEGGRLRVEARGTTQGRQTLKLTATTPAPVQQWANGARMRLGPARVHAKVDAIDLAHLPYVCSYAKGTLSAEADLEQLFTAQPSASLRIESDALQVGEAEKLALSLEARTDSGWLSVDGRLWQRDAERAALEARVPIDWGHRSPAPALRTDGELDATVRLDEIPLRPILRWVPAIAYVSGNASGEVHAQGPVLSPQLSGYISFSEVDLTLIEIGQPLENASGRIHFEGNRVVLERFEVHDRDGILNAKGVLELGEEKWHIELSLEADDFPVRKQGVIIANLDTKTELQATISDENVDVRATIRDAQVWLTGQGLGDVQSLEPHPDIVFASELQDDDAQPQQEEEASPVAVRIRLDASDAFWVRRSDFSVQLSTRLEVQVENGATRITGQVALRRGFIELLGKSFDIEEGTIRFTGADPPNPALDITAKHGGFGGGEEVTVRITGRMSDPEITFVDETGETITAGQAFGPTGGGGAGLAAEDQAISIVSGMTTGLLTLGARRSLGGLVPVISIETAGTQAARLRAGLQADRIIPEFLKGIVQGAYVEGIIGTGQTTASGEQVAAGSSGVSGGVLIELRFPYDFVTTARFWPGQTWSFDVTWEP